MDEIWRDKILTAYSADFIQRRVTKCRQKHAALCSFIATAGLAFQLLQVQISHVVNIANQSANDASLSNFMEDADGELCCIMELTIGQYFATADEADKFRITLQQ